MDHPWIKEGKRIINNKYHSKYIINNRRRETTQEDIFTLTSEISPVRLHKKHKVGANAIRLTQIQEET